MARAARRRIADDDDDDVVVSRAVGQPGIAVDARGGGVIDPTKNVLDLVKAESKYQDAMREALKDRVDIQSTALHDQFKILSEGLIAYQSGMRDAETRRIDQLAQTRQEFQNTIRDMLAESVRTTSTLVSTQLVQIQATFDTRVSKLEAGAFTQAGKQSVADPAFSDAVTRLTMGQSTLKHNTDEALARMAASQIEQTAKMTAAITALGTRETATTSTRMGQGQVIGWVVGAIFVFAAIAGPLIALLTLVLRH